MKSGDMYCNNTEWIGIAKEDAGAQHNLNVLSWIKNMRSGVTYENNYTYLDGRWVVAITRPSA